jgi:predicted nucleic acid-binding protein
MILLDTNVISETLRPQPDAGVLRWLDGRAKMDFWLCAPVIAELRYGAALLPEGRKRDALFAAWDRLEIKGAPAIGKSSSAWKSMRR